MNVQQADPTPTDDSWVMEQARDILMAWFDVAAPEADRLLRVWARRAHAPVRQVATALVFDILHGMPSGCQKGVLRYVEENLRRLPSSGSNTPDLADRQGWETS